MRGGEKTFFEHLKYFQEVLELNQLRQQAIDREQKLFIEVNKPVYCHQGTMTMTL